MEKFSQNRVKDPIQEKLKNLKKAWNADMSKMIDNLINYKKLSNGQPNKFFKEKSSIKDPIPANPTSILSSLLSQFQELSKRSNQIIAAQNEYSKTRKKKQPKQSIVPEKTPLEQQLANFEYELKSEASNSISRFFTKLLTFTRGSSEAARIKKYRMTLLDTCAKIYKELKHFQIEIVKSSDQSIVDANKILHKIWNEWRIVKAGFSTYEQNIQVTPPDVGGKIEKPDLVDNDLVDSDLLNKVNELFIDYKNNFRKLSIVPGYDIELKNIISMFKDLSKDKTNLYNLFISEYNKVLHKINFDFATNGKSFAEIAKNLLNKKIEQNVPIQNEEAISQEPEDKPKELEVTSQAFLKKWLGKTRHQYLGNSTSPFRIDLLKKADDMRATINTIMDSLEKGMDTELLSNLINSISKDFQSIRQLMMSLNLSIPKEKQTKDIGWDQGVF